MNTEPQMPSQLQINIKNILKDIDEDIADKLIMAEFLKRMLHHLPYDISDKWLTASCFIEYDAAKDDSTFIPCLWFTALTQFELASLSDMIDNIVEQFTIKPIIIEKIECYYVVWKLHPRCYVAICYDRLIARGKGDYQHFVGYLSDVGVIKTMMESSGLPYTPLSPTDDKSGTPPA